MMAEHWPKHSGRSYTVITGVTEIAHITTKQDMSRWTRAHADVPGIKWSVFAGENGTMIIVEHAEDRCSQGRQSVSPEPVSPDVMCFDTVPLDTVPLDAGAAAVEAEPVGSVPAPA
jgi:hypothetical protein